MLAIRTPEEVKSMKCFVMMPFAQDYDDVYQAIKRAGKAAGDIDCFRLDDHRPGGRILNRLFEALGETQLCIADLSDNRPNVMWELGYAMAKDQEPILLTRPGQPLPFDLHDMHKLAYDRSRLVQTLERPLAESLQHSVDRLQQRTKAPSKLERLELEVKRLHDIIGSGAAHLTSHTAAAAPLETPAAPALKRLVGVWYERNSRSHVHVRWIGGKLTAVYCFEGNNELSGIYYDWRLRGDWIFARYAWCREPIAGFSFLKAESDTLLAGSWWYDTDADGTAEFPPNPQSGYEAVWERLGEDKVRPWVDAAFGKIEQLGMEHALKQWRAGHEDA
jgi:hypothetical protein